jgi:hypothetical protein
MMEDREEQRIKHKELADRRRREDLADLQSVLRTAAGRRLIWRIIEEGSPLRNAYTGNSNTFYNEGKQAFAKGIFSDILENYPTLYIRMQNEAAKRRKEEDVLYG